MRNYIYLILLASLSASNNIVGQFALRPWSSQTDFTSGQEKYKKEIADFLRMRHGSDSANFCYDVSNYMISVDPFGGVYDSAKFISPKFAGEKIPLDSVSKDSIVFRSQKIVAGTENIAIYNEGKTLIYCYVKHLSLYLYGTLAEADETKLETYIKINGKWIWVANSGTWLHSPFTNSNK